MAGRAALNTFLVVLAAVPMVAVIGDFVLARGNHSLRAEIDQRQHLINQGTQLANVNQALIRQIAVVAVKERDTKLRELLSQNGITINPTPAPLPDGGKGG